MPDGGAGFSTQGEQCFRGVGDRSAESRVIDRRQRFRQRVIAGDLLPKEAVRRCGRYYAGEFAGGGPEGYFTVKANKDGAHFSGLVTCGSVWHCPVCAAKVAEERRREIGRAAKRHIAGGGAIYMAAFTVPHTAFSNCAALRQAVAEAWRKLQQGRQWQDMKAGAGIVGTIRALEVTHGGNGWHPHLHVLIFTDGALPVGLDGKTALESWLFGRWSHLVAKAGLGKVSPEAWSFERAANAVEAGAYVGKWGCAHELAKASSKTGREGNRTPWGILADVAKATGREAMLSEEGRRHVEEDRRLFQDYGIAFKGSRQLTWSKGLKDRYDVAEADDVEIADRDPGDARPALYVSEAALPLIEKRRLFSVILEVAERYEGEELVWHLTRRGLDPGYVKLPAEPPGYRVGVYIAPEFVNINDRNRA